MPEESKIEDPRLLKDQSDQDVEGSERLLDDIDPRENEVESRSENSEISSQDDSDMSGIKELGGVINQSMDTLGVEFSSGADERGRYYKLALNSGDSEAETQVYEDGKGSARIGDREVDVDFSSADKIYTYSRMSRSALEGERIGTLTREDIPNDRISRFDLMASGMQRMELANGDVLHRPPPNPDGVKWIRDVGGANGGKSIVAYTDGRKEVRLAEQAPGFELGQSGRFDRDSKPEVETLPSLRSYVGSRDFGSFDQEVDPATGAVTTKFPDSSAKLESIVYRPGEPEPYTVKFKPGQEDPALMEKIKSGEFRIPVNFEPQGEGPESMNLFPEKWSSLTPLNEGTGSVAVTPEGRLEYTFGENDEEGRTKLIRYPEGDPRGRVERTEYDPDRSEDKLKSSTRVRGENGEIQEIKEFKEEQEPAREALEGEKRNFEYGSEKGSLYIDESTGYLNGIKFESGNRAGQEYRFGHDAEGNLTSMDIELPGEDGASSRVSLQRVGDADRWKVEPADAKIPGFEKLSADENGVLSGNIKLKANGDIVYDAGDGHMEAMRINGSHDLYDLNTYERIRETADGQSSTVYWDGYDWRPGTKTTNEDGTTAVSFEGEGKVKQIVRDARTSEDGTKSDRVLVVRSDGTVFDANWPERRMTRARGENKVELFNSGLKNEKGKSIWMQGQKLESGMVRFQPSSENERQAMASGRLPLGVEYHEQGSITSHYGNGAKVRSDRAGQIEQITYANGEKISLERDAYGQLMRFSGVEGSSYERERRLPASEDGKEFTRWKVVDGENKGQELDASVSLDQNGLISLERANQERISIERNGRIVTYSGDRVVQVRDAQGQNWVQEERQNEEDKKASVWTVSTNGKTMTLEGELELVPDNGRVVVLDGEGVRHGVEPDGARTSYNKEGVETERTYEDGTAVNRTDLGFLNEITFKSADGELMTRKFIYEQGSDGVVRFVGTTLNEKPDEVFADGALRELKNGADFKSFKPADLGAYVEYDDTTGVKSIRSSADKDSKAVKLVDIHGKVVELDENGKVIER